MSLNAPVPFGDTHPQPLVMCADSINIQTSRFEKARMRMVAQVR